VVDRCAAFLHLDAEYHADDQIRCTCGNRYPYPGAEYDGDFLPDFPAIGYIPCTVRKEMEELDEVLRQLENSRRNGFGGENVFVLVLEQTQQGNPRLVSYGIKSIGELAAYIAISSSQSQPEERKVS